MVDFYAIKVMHPAESIEIFERIEWCKENDLDFFNASIMGILIADVYYTADEMQKLKTLSLAPGIEIDLSNMTPKNIGMAFLFKNEADVTAFKLRWV